MSNAKKAEFQGQLRNSSVRFTHDANNNRVSYNNCAGGGSDQDLVYNIKSESAKPGVAQAEVFDKESKNYLTQMSTLNSGKRRSKSNAGNEGEVRYQHYSTIANTHFNQVYPSLNASDV